MPKAVSNISPVVSKVNELSHPRTMSWSPYLALAVLERQHWPRRLRTVFLAQLWFSSTTFS